MKNEVVYDFDGGNTFGYTVVAAEDVELYTKELPGMYAWYLRVLPKPNAINNMSVVGDVFASKRLDAQLVGNLGERYEGVLRKKNVFDGDSSKFHETIHAASTIFCPPLYIGIATKLNMRLSQHLSALQTSLSRVSTFDSVVDTEPLPADLDTEAESNSFGERMGRILRTNGINNVSPLFVKIIYFDRASKADLQRSEWFVNRVFGPLCGRR